MDTNLKTETVVRHFGGVSETAKALGVVRQAVYQWGEYLPDGRAYQVEIVTGGLIKACDPDREVNAA